MASISRAFAPARGVVARATYISARGIASSAVVRSEPKEEPKGLISSLLHGSSKAQAEGLVVAKQHSKLVGRGKYVHELITHKVKPDRVDEYRAAAETYFKTLASDPNLHVKLTGSWETVVGRLDTFVHILEYENYSGFDKSTALFRSHPDLPGLLNKLLPTVESRNSQLMSEFAFWASSPPRETGGIFEMRSYQLKPGTLLEWEAAWRRGIEYRRKYVQPVGAFFGQVGQLHEVHHIWQYPSMEARKATREQAWSVGGWSDTVQQTVKLAQGMQSAILMPMSFSPLK